MPLVNATVVWEQLFSDEKKTVVKTEIHKKTAGGAIHVFPRTPIAALAKLATKSTRPDRPNQYPENMSAFLKIDDCQGCHRSLPWEWTPAVVLNGKALAGTGTWRSPLSRGLCPACIARREEVAENERRTLAIRRDLVRLLGGEKPYREFTFENFKVTPGNRVAYERCRHFKPYAENLYLWGACGLGKTHLVHATARRCFEETLSVAIVPVAQLSRRVRMKEPAQEQSVVDDLVTAEVLVLEDLGAGADTPFSRQILQEVLDRRDFNDRAGLVITSRYSLDELAAKFGEDTIPSRLAGLCRRSIRISGPDYRLMRAKE